MRRPSSCRARRNAAQAPAKRPSTERGSKASARSDVSSRLARAGPSPAARTPIRQRSEEAIRQGDVPAGRNEHRWVGERKLPPASHRHSRHGIGTSSVVSGRRAARSAPSPASATHSSRLRISSSHAIERGRPGSGTNSATGRHSHALARLHAPQHRADIVPQIPRRYVRHVDSVAALLRGQP